MSAPTIDREALVRGLCGAVERDHAREALAEAACFLRVVRGAVELDGYAGVYVSVVNDGPTGEGLAKTASEGVETASYALTRLDHYPLVSSVIAALLDESPASLAEWVGSMNYDEEVRVIRRAQRVCARVQRSLRASKGGAS